MEKPADNKKLIILTATLFGAGYSPVMPGTAASLLALPFKFLIKNNILFALFTGAVIWISFWASGKAERIIGEKDPRQVVIDDFAGQLLALVFMPAEFSFVFLGFVYFRMFDILKLPPACDIEKKKGSLGIVGDDLWAGFFANLLIQAVKFILKIS